MATIVTRSGKGAALTHGEVDANFTNLNADKAEVSAVILATQKGAASGVAPLDATSKISSTYLPSYVDDVLEYANYAALPATGETGKIYVALDTNKTYRWSGSAYVYITSGAVDSVAGKTGVVTLAKADVGLSNVDNTTDALKPISTATQTALDLKAPLASPTFTGTTTAANLAYTGTLTGGTGVVAIGTNQIYKDASGNVGIGTSSPATQLHIASTTAKTRIDTTTAASNNPELQLTAVARQFNIGVGGATFATTALQGSYYIYDNTAATYRMVIDTSGNVGIGTSSPTSKLDIGSGNLNFSGTSQRITGDMSNATITNRLAFQTSTANGNTTLTILPNGTSVASGIVLEGDSAQTNGSFFGVALTASGEARITSGVRGTGTYLPITMLTGGSERLRIDISGNVGIGTSSPATTLDVVGSTLRLRNGLTATEFYDIGRDGVDGYLKFNGAQTSFVGYKFFNTGTERMRIDSSGNVGIGTSSPSFPLQVQTTAEWGIALKMANTSPTARGLTLSQRALGTIASPLTVTNGTIIGGFDAGGYNGTAYTLGYNGGAGIQAIATETWTSISNASALTFFTNSSGSANYTERMRIDSSGNLLVGTTSSAGTYKLQTSTDAYINGIIIGRGAGNIVNNTVLGNTTGAYLTTGVYNTLIGYGAGGGNCTSLQGGTYIGAAMLASSPTANYEIAIGFNLTGKGSATFYAGTNGGGSYNGANTTTWATTSDQRLKKNIVDNNSGLNLINQIQVRNFEYRLPEEVTELPKNSVIDIKGVQLGVIAQEIQQILPDCVKEESTGVLSVQSDNLTWYMVNAIKELKAIIDTQQEQINSLLGK